MKFSVSIPVTAAVLAGAAFAMPASHPSQDLETRNARPNVDKSTGNAALEKRWWERRVLICAGQ
ncbi:hypothetical protein TWF281_001430 [Arthrobotrys megalospora]